MTTTPAHRFNNYTDLPSVEAAYLMETWVHCPVHGELVGLDAWGHVLGRCQSCAMEAARAIAHLEANDLRQEEA